MKLCNNQNMSSDENFARSANKKEILPWNKVISKAQRISVIFIP